MLLSKLRLASSTYARNGNSEFSPRRAAAPRRRCGTYSNNCVLYSETGTTVSTESWCLLAGARVARSASQALQTELIRRIFYSVRMSFARSQMRLAHGEGSNATVTRGF